MDENRRPWDQLTIEEQGRAEVMMIWNEMPRTWASQDDIAAHIISRREVVA